MGNQVVITEPVQKLVVIQPVSEEALSALNIAEKNELRDIAKHEMMLIGNLVSEPKRTIYRHGDEMTEPWPELVPTSYVLLRYEALAIPRGDGDGHP